MSLSTNQVIKYYQTISRTFDKIAKEDGYTNAPDDILSLIFDYTGKIQTKPTCFYQVEVRYDIQSKVHQNRIDSEVKDMIENLYPKAMIEKKKLNPYGKWRSSRKWLKYCGCCNRFYKNIDSHIYREIHRRNYHTKGDLLLSPDVNKRILKEYNDNTWREYQIRNVNTVCFLEWFVYIPIGLPLDKNKDKKNDENEKKNDS